MTQRFFHITLPKCGSQWVRDVLSSQDIWPDFKLHIVKGDLTYSTNRKLFDTKGNFFSPIYGLQRRDWEAMSQNGDRGLVVIRDPRDRLVSLLFSLLYSHSSGSRVDCWRDVLSSQKSIKECLKLMMVTEGSNSLHSFYIAWSEATPSNCMVIRYEDIIADQLASFQKIAEWLEIGFSKDALATAIKQHSFESRAGRSRGEEDKSSHYRMGVPGDWRNYFDRSLGELWENLDPGILCKTGYEESDLWWQSIPDHLESRGSDELSLGSDAPSELTRNETIAKRIKFLESENREKQNIIENLAHACDERLTAINHLKSVADERLRLIETLHVQAKEHEDLAGSPQKSNEA